MCVNCKKTSCSGCTPTNGASLAQALNALAEMKTELDKVKADTKFLSCGHPILALQNADDIALFGEDGIGIKCWEGCAVCNGSAYYSNTAKKNITTPDLRNLFLVGAGDDYSVDDTGGANEVTLSIAEMPAHNHTVTDPGHTHTVTDPGHLHATTQTAHSHGVTDPGHNHTVTNTIALNATPHSLIADEVGVESGGGTSVPDTWSNSTDSLTGDVTLASAQTSLTVNSASITISVNSAYTGITVASRVTGITTVNEGEGEAHENRPPYYAVLFVQKIG